MLHAEVQDSDLEAEIPELVSDLLGLLLLGVGAERDSGLAVPVDDLMALDRLGFAIAAIEVGERFVFHVVSFRWTCMGRV